MKNYLPHTWSTPNLFAKESLIHGKGVFTKTQIKKGETVMIWGGELIKKDQYEAHADQYRELTVVPVSEDYYLGLPITDTSESIDEFINHSCDPSCWLTDEVTVVARQDIGEGEEITIDSATWNDDESEEYTASGECSCGSSDCRKFIRPDDWKNPKLQKKYAEHFSPFLEKRISELKNKI